MSMNALNWTPDKKITWGSSLLIVILTSWFMIFLVAIGAIASIGQYLFWIGAAIGLAIAAIFNWVRPRYENAGRFWKPIYRFLLEQIPPPE